jgi:glycine/D-amino acid oxidase-like deaminating enzyme
MTTKRVDILVVGAGVVGCSIAWHLAHKGARSVLIVDKTTASGGSTGFSSGIVRQFYTHPVLVQMAKQGRDTLANFDEIVGGQAGFVGCGWVLAVDSKALDVARLGMAVQSDVGVSSEWLSLEELGELVPGVRADGLTGGVYESDAGYADPHITTLSYLAAARALGVQYQSNTRVTQWRSRRDRVVGVETSAGPIDAELVILAAGPWTAALLLQLGVDLPITASRHQIVTVREESRPPRTVFSDPTNLVYMRPEGRELTLIGSNDPDDAYDLVEPDGCPPGADPQKIEWMLRSASRRLPAVAQAGVAHHWSGVYDVSADGFPILGAVDGPPGVVVAAGTSGHGFKLSPAIGEIVATSVLDPSDDPRLSLFRLARFADGDLIQSTTTSSLTMMRHLSGGSSTAGSDREAGVR